MDWINAAPARIRDRQASIENTRHLVQVWLEHRWAKEQAIQIVHVGRDVESSATVSVL